MVSGEIALAAEMYYSVEEGASVFRVVKFICLTSESKFYL